MIRRIELENFMTHQHTVIEPAAGVTVLIGPNNCGKSAVVNALQMVCENERGSACFIRHGADRCAVTIETADGHLIRWRRTSKSCSYEIDGTQHDRLTKFDGKELHQALRLPPVEAEDKDLPSVHFGFQKQPLFLLDISKQKAAQFFAASSDVTQLFAMQTLLKQRKAEASNTRRIEEERQRQLDLQLGVLDPMTDLDARLTRLETQFGELQLQYQQIEQLTRLTDELERASREVWLATSRTHVLDKLQSPPAQGDEQELEGLIGKLSRSEKERSLQQQYQQALACLAAPPHVQDELALQGTIDQLCSTCTAVDRAERQQTTLQRLNPPPALADEQNLAEIIAELLCRQDLLTRNLRELDVLGNLTSPPVLQEHEGLEQTLGRLAEMGKLIAGAQARLNQLRPLGAPPELLDESPLAQLCRQLLQAAQQAQHCQADLDAAAIAIKEFEQQSAKQLQGQVCPTCGGELNPSTIFSPASCESAPAAGEPV